MRLPAISARARATIFCSTARQFKQRHTRLGWWQENRGGGATASGRDGIFVTVVGPERFIGDRALGWSGVLAVLARVGYRIISSHLRGPRYVLTGPGPGAGEKLADVAKAAAAGRASADRFDRAFRTRADAAGFETRRSA